MATFDEMSPGIRLFMRTYPFSRYAVSQPEPARLLVPLARARFALVTTAGFRAPDDLDFDHGIAKGDTSYREISGTIETRLLVDSHRSEAFDHSGVARDRNLALPLDRFRELEAAGMIGRLNHRHFSFMGSITDPRRLIDETAPEVAANLRADGVDAVLLTPL